MLVHVSSSSWGSCAVEVFGLLLNWVIFLLPSWKSSSYTVDNGRVSDVPFTATFSESFVSHFILVTGLFARTSFGGSFLLDFLPRRPCHLQTPFYFFLPSLHACPSLSVPHSVSQGLQHGRESGPEKGGPCLGPGRGEKALVSPRSGWCELQGFGGHSASG